MTDEAVTEEQLLARVAQLQRQLEIEETLESLRVEIAGMRESADLADVVRHVERSLRDLGASCDSVGINVIDSDELSMVQCSASESGIRVTGPVLMAGVDAWSEYVDHWHAGTTYSRLLEEAHKSVEDSSDRWVVDVPYPQGMVAMSRPGRMPFGDEEIALLERFAGVFAMAYARFRDLQAAEARAGEMEREAAYERVRGAMLVARSAEDILAADRLMAEELKRLGVRFSACGINVVDEKSRSMRTFAATSRKQALALDYDFDHPDVADLVAHWRRSEVFARQASDSYRQRLRNVLPPEAASFIDRIKTVVDVPFTYGTLGMNSTEIDEFSVHEIDILQGFAEVISLAYTRYLDFQELEAQHEQTRQANRLKSDFLARMSHDLRTPMNAILGYVSLLLRKTKDAIEERQYRNLENIRQSGGNMLRLIDYMQDLSTIAAGSPEVSVDEVDIRALVGACVEAHRPAIRDGVEFEAELEDVGTLRTDGERVRQVVTDVLDNAVKFTEAGVVAVSLRAAQGRIEISVRDTGVGIPAEDLPYLFDEFYYMARTKSLPEAGGDGLSMARAKKSIELLGGILYVDSERGEGTTFTLRLADYESPL